MGGIVGQEEIHAGVGDNAGIVTTYFSCPPKNYARTRGKEEEREKSWINLMIYLPARTPGRPLALPDGPSPSTTGKRKCPHGRASVADAIPSRHLAVSWVNKMANRNRLPERSHWHLTDRDGGALFRKRQVSVDSLGTTEAFFFLCLGEGVSLEEVQLTRSKPAGLLSWHLCC